MSEGEEPMRLLVLSGDFGDGHKQAAVALREACGAQGQRMQADIVDFTQQVYPRLHPVMRYSFLKGVEKLPSVYGYFFHRTRHTEGLSAPFRMFLELGLGRLAALIEERSPDAVICTFPLAAAAVSLLKERGQLKVPLVTVITDHTDHSLWMNPGTDLYLTGSAEAAAALRRRGVHQSAVRVTGIPVRPRFGEPGERDALRRRFGLRPELPVVLVMGGGSGMLAKEVRRLLRSEGLYERLQLVLICGSNEGLRTDFERAARGWPPDRVFVLGYVEEIHEWMAAADLLLTKPGGLTTTEAVTMGLPMLLVKPIPGQEEDNAEVLVKAGVAARASDARGLREQLLELLGHPDALERMRTEALRIRPVRSAERALESIAQLLVETRLLAEPELEPAAALRVQ
ncbi:glycosyltransferase [Paenibacillus filicis]|uniref:Glycosyltransferase n=1 Tax=Paenibacillus gyeongsangnamensis TaxID=3388067 RepID=A0ABT4QB56_9BACL|nr:glycosyltransferase [Paenibacillus filicis]MCZ8514063.1 glycosyltransferase [Paenibacillus filicis]